MTVATIMTATAAKKKHKNKQLLAVVYEDTKSYEFYSYIHEYVFVV